MNSKIGSIFISHSVKNPDYEVTEILAKSLEEVGFNVWWDKERLEGGDFFPVEILEAIIKQNYFIYIISMHSIASKWCLRELIRATELDKKIIPLLLEKIPNETSPLELAGLHYIDIRLGISEAFPDILKALGLGMPSNKQILDDPFAKDGNLIKTIAEQLTYAKTFTNSLNLILMLEKIGIRCCETERASNLFKGMRSQSHFTGMKIDYDKVRAYLLTEWYG
ncbi:MAG: toll/interleukin-1 receptor domain-containing protein [Methanocellales archaeon]|nr:toll/interleukin-1 receptor domain-containing protein [Methanocellales archaeon]